MQNRHLNRKLYFCELANTAREFYLNFLQPHITLSTDTRVLEIGCGEGGNLLPFAEMGCNVTGIDICLGRINEAQTFFAECHQQGTFICKDFLFTNEPKGEAERFDLILVHDVIEHIAPCRKKDFLFHITHFLKKRRHRVLWLSCMAKPFRRSSANQCWLCLQTSLHPSVAPANLPKRVEVKRSHKR